MTNELQLKRWLMDDAERVDALIIAYRCALYFDLKNWCLAAGFVRNLVWDKLHHRKHRAQLNDIDFIYFDISDCSLLRDKEIEAWLLESNAGMLECWAALKVRESIVRVGL